MSTGRLAAVSLADDFSGGLLHGIVVDRHLDVLDDVGDVDVGGDHVARNFEIDGAAGFCRDFERLSDVRRRGPRVVEDGRVLGDLLIHLELRFKRLHLVVDGHVGASLNAPGAAAQHDNRRLLRVGTRDGVDHVEAAGAVRHAAHADTAPDARRPVSRETDRGLVAQSHQLEPAVVFEGFVEREDEVAGDAEDLADAVPAELVEEEVAEFHPAGGYLAPASRGRASATGCKMWAVISLKERLMNSKGILTLALSVAGSTLLFGETPRLPPAPASPPPLSVQAPLDPGYAALIATCKTPPPGRGGRGPGGAGNRGGGRGPAPAQGERDVTVTAIPGVIAAGAKWTFVWQQVGNNGDGIVGTNDGGLLLAQNDSSVVLKLDSKGKPSTAYATRTPAARCR